MASDLFFINDRDFDRLLLESRKKDFLLDLRLDVLKVFVISFYLESLMAVGDSMSFNDFLDLFGFSEMRFLLFIVE